MILNQLEERMNQMSHLIGFMHGIIITLHQYNPDSVLHELIKDSLKTIDSKIEILFYQDEINENNKAAT